MKGKDEIKNLFSDKLSGYEAKVKPELWSNISANIGTTSAAASTSFTILTKTIIGLSIVAAAVTGVVLLTNEPATNSQSDVKPELSVVENDTSKSEAPIDDFEETETSQEIVNDGLAPLPRPNNVNIEQEASNTDEVDNEVVNIPLNEQGGALVQEDNPLNDLIEDNGSEINIETDPVIEEVVVEEPKDEAEPVVEEVKTELVLSNIFSPNNDMNNDFLFVESEGLTDFNVVVLNTQNKVVYQSNDPDFQWNGTGMDGAPVDSGNYVYFVTARDKNGNPVNQHSPLTVVR